MKKNLIFITLFLCSSFFSVAQGNYWLQKASLMGSERLGAVGFSILSSMGYIGLGEDLLGNNKKDFWEYNPLLDAWQQKADFGGTARKYAVGFSINNKGYVGTGHDGSYKNDFWEYNATTNVWTVKAIVPGGVRRQAVGFGINSVNRGYIGSGWDGTFYKGDFWEYNPTADMWTVRTSLAVARRSAVGISTATKGYVGTGWNGSFTNDFLEFDPVSNTWTAKANYPGGNVTYATGFSINPYVYVGTGNYSTSFWCFDPSLNTWAMGANYGGTASERAVGMSMYGKGYIGTGLDAAGLYHKDFWEYTPSTTPLPIELIFFNASIKNSGVCIQWETASETNNDYFEIERTSDGVTFSSLGIIDGAGNSTTNLNYEYIDNNVFEDLSGQTIYYRLKQVDFDGSFSYSSIVSVSKDIIVGDINVYPNPCSSYLTISVQSSENSRLELLLFDSSGNKIVGKVMHLQKGSNELKADLSKCDKGIHFLKLICESGEVYVKRIKKE